MSWDESAEPMEPAVPDELYRRVQGDPEPDEVDTWAHEMRDDPDPPDEEDE